MQQDADAPGSLVVQQLARTVGEHVCRQLLDGARGQPAASLASLPAPESQRGSHSASPGSSDRARDATQEPIVRKAQCLVLEEFLVADELFELLAFALEREAAFETTRVLSGSSRGGVVDYTHRRSRVLSDLGKYKSIFADRVLSVLPYVLRRLGHPPFPIDHIEVQLTATNDGEFFRVHNDNTHEAVRRRELTYVYYFHREPKAFEGGELRLYDTYVGQGRLAAAESFIDVEPRQNQMVFFPSMLLHEVRPVRCPSQALADSRFTVNGWFHRR